MTRSLTRTRIIGLVALVVLVVAMVLNTKFLTPTELAAALPKPFDPKETAAQLWDQAQTDIPSRAADLGQVITAIQSDPKAAATKFKAVSPAENAYVFAVKTTATVEEATDASLRLKAPGVSDQTPVIVPLTTAVNGSVLRDAMGFKFADAPGQTQYQYVGDELKKLMQQAAQSGVSDPASLKGKKVLLVGVLNLQGSSPAPRPKPQNVQPVTIEAGS